MNLKSNSEYTAKEPTNIKVQTFQLVEHVAFWRFSSFFLCPLFPCFYSSFSSVVMKYHMLFIFYLYFQNNIRVVFSLITHISYFKCALTANIFHDQAYFIVSFLLKYGFLVFRTTLFQQTHISFPEYSKVDISARNLR